MSAVFQGAIFACMVGLGIMAYGMSCDSEATVARGGYIAGFAAIVLAVSFEIFVAFGGLA